MTHHHHHHRHRHHHNIYIYIHIYSSYFNIKMILEPFSMAMSPVCPGSHSDFPWQGAKRGWLAKRFSTSDLPSSWRVVNMAAPAKSGEDFSKHGGTYGKMEHDGKYWENVGNIMKHQGTSGKYVGQSFVYRYNPQNIMFKRENMGTCCTQRCSPNECWPPRCWSLRGFHFGSRDILG